MTDITFYALGMLIIGFAFCWILSIVKSLHNKEVDELRQEIDMGKYTHTSDLSRIDSLRNALEREHDQAGKFSETILQRGKEIRELKADLEKEHAKTVELDCVVNMRDAEIRELKSRLEDATSTSRIAMETVDRQEGEISSLNDTIKSRDASIKELHERYNDALQQIETQNAAPSEKTIHGSGRCKGCGRFISKKQTYCDKCFDQMAGITAEVEK